MFWKHLRLNCSLETSAAETRQVQSSVYDHLAASVIRVKQGRRVHEVVNDAREGREPATAVDGRHGAGAKAEEAAGRKAGVDGVFDVRLAAVALDDALSSGKPDRKKSWSTDV